MANYHDLDYLLGRIVWLHGGPAFRVLSVNAGQNIIRLLPLGAPLFRTTWQLTTFWRDVEAGIIDLKGDTTNA